MKRTVVIQNANGQILARSEFETSDINLGTVIFYVPVTERFAEFYGHDFRIEITTERLAIESRE